MNQIFYDRNSPISNQLHTSAERPDQCLHATTKSGARVSGEYRQFLPLKTRGGVVSIALYTGSTKRTNGEIIPFSYFELRVNRGAPQTVSSREHPDGSFCLVELDAKIREIDTLADRALHPQGYCALL